MIPAQAGIQFLKLPHVRREKFRYGPLPTQGDIVMSESNIEPDFESGNAAEAN